MRFFFRKLIQFGLKNKIIRRLHGYPIKLANDAKPSPKLQAILKYLNGTYSQDEISCKSGKLNYHLPLSNINVSQKVNIMDFQFVIKYHYIGHN